MAEDPVVSSIEVDCLQRADTSLPESDSSSPGDQHDMDQMEAVARRLSVQVGAPWGIDRIDGSFDDGDLTGKGVRVYVVDDGVQGSHDDFGGRVVNGHTVRAASVARVQSSECPHTPHGTHVASTVGGLKHGVAKDVTIVPAFACFKIPCSDGRTECSYSSDISANLECAPPRPRLRPPPPPPPPPPPTRRPPWHRLRATATPHGLAATGARPPQRPSHPRCCRWALTDCAAHPKARCVAT